MFGAVGEYHADRPAEIRIGDCLVMVTAAGARELFPAFLYVYVDDADATYRRALSAGAVSLEPPLDTLRRSSGHGAGPVRKRLADCTRHRSALMVVRSHTVDIGKPPRRGRLICPVPSRRPAVDP